MEVHEGLGGLCCPAGVASHVSLPGCLGGLNFSWESYFWGYLLCFSFQPRPEEGSRHSLLNLPCTLSSALGSSTQHPSGL